jgi:hypothetical protein
LAMTEMNQLVGRRWWWLRLSVGVNTAEFRWIWLAQMQFCFLYNVLSP